MKPKLTLILSSILLMTLATSAQTTSKSIVSGGVADANNKPLANITVSLLKATDSSLVKAAVSDEKGNFEISLAKAGKFLLSYSSLGYEKSYSSDFEISIGQDYKANTVILKQVIKNLQDVTVTSKKPMIEIRADKTIFNVENSINATGSNALELLQKSPGVQVDNNGNISMKGKNGTKIYIDGKPTQLDAKNLAEQAWAGSDWDLKASWL